jgi:hypothetical protein
MNSKCQRIYVRAAIKSTSQNIRKGKWFLLGKNLFFVTFENGYS